MATQPHEIGTALTALRQWQAAIKGGSRPVDTGLTLIECMCAPDYPLTPEREPIIAAIVDELTQSDTPEAVSFPTIASTHFDIARALGKAEWDRIALETANGSPLDVVVSPMGGVLLDNGTTIETAEAFARRHSGATFLLAIAHQLDTMAETYAIYGNYPSGFKNVGLGIAAAALRL